MKRKPADELFPDVAQEAERNKLLTREAGKVGAQMRLADNATDMQAFILRVFREKGPCCTVPHLAELHELLGDASKEERSKAHALFICTLQDMKAAGTLWCHEWPDDEGWTWGISGVHSKRAMLRGVREAKERGRAVLQEKVLAQRERKQAAKN